MNQEEAENILLSEILFSVMARRQIIQNALDEQQENVDDLVNKIEKEVEDVQSALEIVFPNWNKSQEHQHYVDDVIVLPEGKYFGTTIPKDKIKDYDFP